MALDRDHLDAKRAEDGSGVARAGADLEHPLAALQGKGLADRGDDPGLGDRLALGDRQRRIGIGAGALAVADEVLARHLLHRRQHPLVADPAPAQLALDHPPPLGGEVAACGGRAAQKM